MSNWVEIRDSLLEAMQIEKVGRELKNEFIVWLSKEGIGFAQAFADEVIKECKEDAPKEKGWCKIRDAFVLPVALNIGMYILKMVLTKSLEEKTA